MFSLGEKTLPFIRTSEFLWQEGHTAHIDEEDARQETMQMLTIYKDVVEGLLAIPVYDGQKHLQNALQGQSIHFLLKQ